MHHTPCRDVISACVRAWVLFVRRLLAVGHAVFSPGAAFEFTRSCTLPGSQSRLCFSASPRVCRPSRHGCDSVRLHTGRGVLRVQNGRFSLALSVWQWRSCDKPVAVFAFCYCLRSSRQTFPRGIPNSPLLVGSSQPVMASSLEKYPSNNQLLRKRSSSDLIREFPFR